MTSERTMVTGFGPFLAIDANPSEALARGCGRPHAVLEVSYAAADAFLDSLEPESFDRLLLLGVARRTALTPEIFARNEIGPTPDTRGPAARGPIDRFAPLLLPSTLWEPEMVGELFPLAPLNASYNAGRYLCNYILFRSLQRFPDRRVGFLHVPPTKVLPMERQAAMLDAVLNHIERASLPTLPRSN